MPADAGAIAAIYAPHVDGGVVSFEATAPDAAGMARRIAAGGDLYPWLVAARDGVVLGYAYAGAFNARAAYRWAVETTVYVAAAAQGHGVGRRLYGALIEGLRAQGFTQAIARIALPNPGSIALHARLGFAAIGVERAVGWKQGRWIDVALWQRALADPASPQADPASPQADPASPQADPASPQADPASPQADPASPQADPASPQADPRPYRSAS